MMLSQAAEHDNRAASQKHVASDLQSDCDLYAYWHVLVQAPPVPIWHIKEAVHVALVVRKLQDCTHC
jgi:hypothetical protein